MHSSWIAVVHSSSRSSVLAGHPPGTFYDFCTSHLRKPEIADVHTNKMSNSKESHCIIAFNFLLPWKITIVTLCQLILVVLGTWPTGAAQPVIGKIEMYSTNQVLVHFDVQANTTCILQWTDMIPTNRVSITWSNLWTSPNLPFFEHYIIVDTRTSRHRFYRLQVSF
jgi:hypothetical protein